MSEYSTQIQLEQNYVDNAYTRLDEIRQETREHLDTIRKTKQSAADSLTLVAERDARATAYENQLIQLRGVEDRLVFGRLDDEKKGRLHIGRIGLSDKNYNPIVIDWRAEVARPFYEATPMNHGTTIMRRHITLHLRTVTAIEDEALDLKSDKVSQAAKNGTITGEGALLASLATRRTGKMTDIVATIQAEQDKIIRADMRQALVVQGGPGTGKTAVALHRAAYLLYTHRATLAHSGVLIVGPSQTFLNYIDQVLPSLGETGVVSRTISTLLPGHTCTAQDTPRVAAIKGEARMAHAIENAVRARERIPSHLPEILLSAGAHRVTVPMHENDFRKAITDARRTGKPHNQARETFVKSMMGTMMARYASLAGSPGRSEMEDARQQLRMNDDFRRAVNLAWLPMTAEWMIADMFAKPMKLKSYAPWLTARQIDALRRPKDAPFTVSDVPLLDEAMELLGPDPQEVEKIKAQDRQRELNMANAKATLSQNGIGGGLVSAESLLDAMGDADTVALTEHAGDSREWTYGHVVVDEAQELTQMDWRMLLRRCPSRSFTIVGDVAQTSALGGTRSWKRTLDPLFGDHGWSLRELSIDYRNPREVSDIAGEFAKSEGLYVSTVSSVRNVPDSVRRVTIEDSSALFDRVAEATAECVGEFVGDNGAGRVAVICDREILDGVRKLTSLRLKQTLSSDQWRRITSQDVWDSQVMVCEPQDVKGLEFDAVILVEPGLIGANAVSRPVAASDLYVAMTRPTQRLVVVRTASDADDMPL